MRVVVEGKQRVMWFGRVVGVVAVVAVMLGATACGGDDGGDDPAESPTAEGTPLRPTATPAPEGTRTDGAIESPERALQRQIELLNDGDFGEEWDELHPAQQSLVPRQLFMDCLAPNDFQLTLDIIETKDGELALSQEQGTPAKRISARLSSEGETLDREFFEILVDTRWRWVITDMAQLNAYRAGVCP